MTPQQQAAAMQAESQARAEASDAYALSNARAQAARLRSQEQASHAAQRLLAAGGRGLARRSAQRYWQRASLLRTRRGCADVDLEPAWPIGHFGWNFHRDLIELVETGYTPSHRVVPMTAPGGKKLSASQDGEELAVAIVAGHREFEHSVRDDTWMGPRASWSAVGAAMHQLAADLGCPAPAPDLPIGTATQVSANATPARFARVQELAAAGVLSPQEADEYIADGRVSDANWERVRLLGGEG